MECLFLFSLWLTIPFFVLVSWICFVGYNSWGSLVLLPQFPLAFPSAQGWHSFTIKLFIIPCWLGFFNDHVRDLPWQILPRCFCYSSCWILWLWSVWYWCIYSSSEVSGQASLILMVLTCLWCYLRSLILILPTVK